MLTVAELRRLAERLSATQLEAQLGPFVLIQRPPEQAVLQMTLAQSAGRTVMLRSGASEDRRSLWLSFDQLEVLTLPPLGSVDELVVGRLPDCDVVVDHASVSKRHAVLRWEAEASRCVLRDGASTNGTIVNGVKLGRKADGVLRDGDEVSFGDADFCFLTTRSLSERMHTGQRS